MLLTEDEARHAYDLGDRYVIVPQPLDRHAVPEARGEPLPDGFRFSSDGNDVWLDGEELLAMAKTIPATQRRLRTGLGGLKQHPAGADHRG